jgi:hypothetical protein
MGVSSWIMSRLDATSLFGRCRSLTPYLASESYSEYDSGMAAEKVSLSLEEELVGEARAVVGARGLSSYVNRALRHQLQRDRLAALLAELEQEKGPIEPRVVEEVRREWPAPGETATRRSA